MGCIESTEAELEVSRAPTDASSRRGAGSDAKEQHGAAPLPSSSPNPLSITDEPAAHGGLPLDRPFPLNGGTADGPLRSAQRRPHPSAAASLSASSHVLASASNDHDALAPSGSGEHPLTCDDSEDGGCDSARATTGELRGHVASTCPRQGRPPPAPSPLSSGHSRRGTGGAGGGAGGAGQTVATATGPLPPASMSGTHTLARRVSSDHEGVNLGRRSKHAGIMRGALPVTIGEPGVLSGSASLTKRRGHHASGSTRHRTSVAANGSDDAFPLDLLLQHPPQDLDCTASPARSLSGMPTTGNPSPAGSGTGRQRHHLPASPRRSILSPNASHPAAAAALLTFAYGGGTAAANASGASAAAAGGGGGADLVRLMDTSTDAELPPRYTHYTPPPAAKLEGAHPLTVKGVRIHSYLRDAIATTDVAVWLDDALDRQYAPPTLLTGPATASRRRASERGSAAPSLRELAAAVSGGSPTASATATGFFPTRTAAIAHSGGGLNATPGGATPLRLSMSSARGPTTTAAGSAAPHPLAAGPQPQQQRATSTGMAPTASSPALSVPPPPPASAADDQQLPPPAMMTQLFSPDRSVLPPAAVPHQQQQLQQLQQQHRASVSVAGSPSVVAAGSSGQTSSMHGRSPRIVVALAKLPIYQPYVNVHACVKEGPAGTERRIDPGLRGAFVDAEIATRPLFGMLRSTPRRAQPSVGSSSSPVGHPAVVIASSLAAEMEEDEKAAKQRLLVQSIAFPSEDPEFSVKLTACGVTSEDERSSLTTFPLNMMAGPSKYLPPSSCTSDIRGDDSRSAPLSLAFVRAPVAENASADNGDEGAAVATNPFHRHHQHRQDAPAVTARPAADKKASAPQGGFASPGGHPIADASQQHHPSPQSLESKLSASVVGCRDASVTPFEPLMLPHSKGDAPVSLVGGHGADANVGVRRRTVAENGEPITYKPALEAIPHLASEGLESCPKAASAVVAAVRPLDDDQHPASRTHAVVAAATTIQLRRRSPPRDVGAPTHSP